jgi:hypothetical protein
MDSSSARVRNLSSMVSRANAKATPGRQSDQQRNKHILLGLRRKGLVIRSGPTQDDDGVRGEDGVLQSRQLRLQSGESAVGVGQLLRQESTDHRVLSDRRRLRGEVGDQLLLHLNLSEDVLLRGQGVVD